MFKAKYISNCLSENLDELKVAALYYDEIEIMNNNVYTLEPLKNKEDKNIAKVRGAYKCVTDEFTDKLKLLEEEGIIKYFDSTDYRLESIDKEKQDKTDEPDELMFDIMEKSYELINEADKKPWYIRKDEKGISCKFEPEVKKIHEEFINKLKEGAKIDFEFVHTYYANLLTYLLYNIATGNNTITSSHLLDSYVNDFYLENLMENRKIKFESLNNPSVNMEAIRLFLPDVSKLSIEDILELRFKLNDELQKFRYYSKKLNDDLRNQYSQEEIMHKTKKCVETTLKPAVNDLSSKLEGIKLNTASKLLNDLKNPKSYAPLLGNIFANIPSHIALLLSLGMISTKNALEYIRDKNKIKNNGLYYLLKLDQYK